MKFYYTSSLILATSCITRSPIVEANCPFFETGTPPAGHPSVPNLASPQDKTAYKSYLNQLDISNLYNEITRVMYDSKSCWPADGPQDNDISSYAGLFGRLAWHCAGTLRIINGTKSEGGCEGGGIRFWPEREWRDNGNLDQARAILSEVKLMPEYNLLSWGDLITFAGTVGIKDSGGPTNKFCFGRTDNKNGNDSIKLGVEGITDSSGLGKTDSPCGTSFHWSEQDITDDPRCNQTQADGRIQASHSVGLIYVYPHGPQLKAEHPEFVGGDVHQRSARLSALEVRDTFSDRMGWTDQETVALIGGGKFSDLFGLLLLHTASCFRFVCLWSFLLTPSAFFYFFNFYEISLLYIILSIKRTYSWKSSRKLSNCKR